MNRTDTGAPFTDEVRRFVEGDVSWGGHPHRCLLRLSSSFAHRHRDTVVRRIIGVDPVSAGLQDGAEPLHVRG